MDFKDNSYLSLIDTFVHEVLHTLFFEPEIFEGFPGDSKGAGFLYRDGSGRSWVVGDSIRETVQKHFQCANVKGGRRQLCIYVYKSEMNTLYLIGLLFVTFFDVYW